MMTMKMIEDKPGLRIADKKEGVNPSLQIVKERGVNPGRRTQAAQERVNSGLPATCRKGIAERPVCAKR
jgi:hypothetical protein